MKLKESMVFVLMVVGLVAAMGGFALVSRGLTYGWLGVAIAAPIALLVARNMRLQSSAAAPATETKREE